MELMSEDEFAKLSMEEMKAEIIGELELLDEEAMNEIGPVILELTQLSKEEVKKMEAYLEGKEPDHENIIEALAFVRSNK